MTTPDKTADEIMFGHLTEYAKAELTRHALLCAHLDYAWDRLRPRLDGLTDEEYFYAPATDGDVWTVQVYDDGNVHVDWTYPEPEPPPFTTIGWRLTHIAMMLDTRADYHFGPGTMDLEAISWPGAAQASLGWLDSSWAMFRGGVAGLTDSDLDRRSAGPPGTADEHFPLAMTIQHLTLECIHQGAEVALLRDLYRVRSGRT
ncbi:DinB family protein [soil metagenome]